MTKFFKKWFFRFRGNMKKLYFSNLFFLYCPPSYGYIDNLNLALEQYLISNLFLG